MTETAVRSSGVPAERDVLPVSESQYPCALYGMPVPVMLVSSELNVAKANEAACRVFGGDPTGRRVAELFGCESDTSLKPLDATRPVQLTLKADDRHYVFTLLPRPQAKDYCVIGQDVTASKIAEQSLSESEAQLRVIIEAAIDAVIVLDGDGRITLWNNAAEEIFGYSAAEVYGHDFQNLVVSDKNSDVVAEALKLYSVKGTGKATDRTIRFAALRRDLSSVALELSLSAIQLGEDRHSVAIVRDVSERVARQEAHDGQIAQYVAMINAVPALMYLKDIDQKYIMVNRAFCDLAGKGLDDIVGHTTDEIFDYHQCAAQCEIERQVMDNDQPISRQEERLVDEDGNERWTSTTTVPTHDQQGLVSGVVGLVQDVTELHMSREKLIQADKMAAIGTLAAGVAHEINNPVGFIHSNLSTMAKYVTKIREYMKGWKDIDSDTNESLTEILDDFGDAISESQDGTERVKKIVADLKSFSRVDRSQKEPFNLNEGLESTLNIVWNELKYKCTVEKHYGDIPDLLCIPNQLNQVFMNLLVNAGHAIQEDSGTITITTRADEHNIYVSIEDTGMGIPRENLKRIFEPFFTTKEVSKGTGLGLSMCYDIVKKHNGKIDVRSEVGEGTEFTITLPLEGLEGEQTQHPAG